MKGLVLDIHIPRLARYRRNTNDSLCNLNKSKSRSSGIGYETSSTSIVCVGYLECVHTLSYACLADYTHAQVCDEQIQSLR